MLDIGPAPMKPDPEDIPVPDHIVDACRTAGQVFAALPQKHPGVVLDYFTAEPSGWRPDSVDWELSIRLHGTVHAPREGYDVDLAAIRLVDLLAWRLPHLAKEIRYTKAKAARAANGE